MLIFSRRAFTPIVSKIVRGYYPFVYNKSTETFDQPEAAQDLIANFQSLNPGLKDHKDLAGIVEAGVKSTDNSTSSLKKLLSALSQLQRYFFVFDERILLIIHASVPVLVVVDGVNGLFMEETSYKDSNSCPVPAQKLSILRDLSSLFTGETVMVSTEHCT